MKGDLQDDERAISIAVTHALTVAITAILVTGLLISSGTLLESQEEDVGQRQLSDIGSDAATYINEFDRLNRTGTDVTASVEPNYPARVVDSYSYRIALFSDGTLVVESPGLGELAEYRIDTDTDIEGGTVPGTDPEINLCKNPQRITVGGCN